jgi:hypothetical protein
MTMLFAVKEWGYGPSIGIKNLNFTRSKQVYDIAS